MPLQILIGQVQFMHLTSLLQGGGGASAALSSSGLTISVAASNSTNATDVTVALPPSAAAALAAAEAARTQYDALMGSFAWANLQTGWFTAWVCPPPPAGAAVSPECNFFDTVSVAQYFRY